MTLPAWMPSPSRLGGLAWALKVALASGGLPDAVISFKGGIGDDIMGGTVARELRRRGRRKVWQLTDRAELFDRDPNITAMPQDFRLRRLCELFRVSVFDLEYPHPPPAHLIAAMCKAAGIDGEIELRPRLFLTEAEKYAGKVAARPQIAIQTSSLGARYPMRNKQWSVARFQAVADALAGDFDLVQLGSASDPPLGSVLDFRGKTMLRETAAILSASQVFVGLVSGLMHMARAVDCRSVIVYGGREHPSQSGYSANENLHWEGPCAPCWQRDDCDYDRICMAAIEPAAVIEAVRRQADRYGTALPVDRATIA